MPRTARVVAFSTTPEMVDRIDEVARSRGMTRSELLRDAFRAYDPGGGVARETAARYGAATGFARVRDSRAELARVCRARGVARLWLFGSAVRDDFMAGESDYDFMVEWRDSAPKGPWLSHLLDLESDLSAIVGAHVDVVEVGTVRNRLVAAQMERERVLIYDAARP